MATAIVTIRPSLQLNKLMPIDPEDTIAERLPPLGDRYTPKLSSISKVSSQFPHPLENHQHIVVELPPVSECELDTFGAWDADHL